MEDSHISMDSSFQNDAGKREQQAQRQVHSPFSASSAGSARSPTTSVEALPYDVLSDNDGPRSVLAGGRGRGAGDVFSDEVAASDFDARSFASLDSAMYEDVGNALLSDVEDEKTPLVGAGGHNSNKKKAHGATWGSMCSCPNHPRCRKLWQVVTPERIKTGVFVIIFVLVVVLFTRKAETPEKLDLVAIVENEPYVHELSDRYAFAEFRVTMQELTTHHPDNVQLDLSLLSGSVCTGTEPECSFQWFFSKTVEREVEHRFELDPEALSTVVVSANTTVPVAISLVVDELAALAGYEVIIAAIILVGVYTLIVFELVHRTIAAMFGAFVALAVLSNLHERPSFEEILTWIDWETCGLLFGMMVMVGIFSTTGFFEFCAVRMYKLSKGNLWHLVVLLCLFTAVVSAFLDNVTTILLLTPVTIRLCRVLDVDPVQILIALVVFSNVGGTATAIGDPPNIIIVSDSRISATKLVNFGTFTLHVAPGVIMALVVTFFVVRCMFHSKVDREPNKTLEREIELWRKTVNRMKGNTEEEQHVREKLERHIQTLEREALEQKDEEVQAVDIKELEEKYVIRDWPLFINSSIILAGVIVLFFLHSFVPVNLNLAWIAVIGSIVHLLVAGVKDIEDVLEHVEWGTLMFFAALFILMEALDKMGLIGWIGARTSDLIATVPAEGSGRLAAAVVLIIWVSGIASAFIDNIPFTTAMIPVVLALNAPPLSLPLTPMVWSLSFGACFGGNGTLIGASANVVCAGLSEQEGYPISFNTFFKKGFIVMLVTLAVATVYMLIFHVAIPWHE